MCAANITTAKHARLGGSSGGEYDRLGASSGKTGRNPTADRAGRRRRRRGASLEPEETPRVALFAITWVRAQQCGHTVFPFASCEPAGYNLPGERIEICPSEASMTIYSFLPPPPPLPLPSELHGKTCSLSDFVDSRAAINSRAACCLWNKPTEDRGGRAIARFLRPHPWTMPPRGEEFGEHN